jgi:hypothetical protein
MTYGVFYDCSEDGEFFHTFDNCRVGIMLHKAHFTVIQELHANGVPKIVDVGQLQAGRDFMAKKQQLSKSKQEALDEVMKKIAAGVTSATGRSGSIVVDDDPLGHHLYGPGGIIRDFGLTSDSHTTFEPISKKDKPDAPAYKHQNATRKTRDTQQDTESTKELRKYRYQPDTD